MIASLNQRGSDEDMNDTFGTMPRLRNVEHYCELFMPPVDAGSVSH
jgi:hypothetical protein